MFTNEEEGRTVDGVNTIIGQGTTLKGDVKVEGSIQIDGDFDGTIDATDTLVVGESGRVEGDATVANAVIGGHMFGNVVASGKIELQRGSQLLGDIKTRGLVIEDGVVFQGNCQMGDIVEPRPHRREEEAELDDEMEDIEDLEESEATL